MSKVNTHCTRGGNDKMSLIPHQLHFIQGWRGLLKVAMCVAGGIETPILSLSANQIMWGYYDDPLLALIQRYDSSLHQTCGPPMPAPKPSPTPTVHSAPV